MGYELAGNAALFQGDYKIVVNRKPLGDGEWSLFNIKKDPGETRDLAQEEPARLQQMLSAYEQYQRANKVLDMPAGYGHIKQLLINTLHQQFRTPLLVGLLTLLILLPFLVAYLSRRKP
ncbi:MAG: Arylsulfatase [Halieaceae bacterium]|nr:MAG: Arylsulfatase [Halieaceae bacterium]